jgi:Peptidase family M48
MRSPRAALLTVVASCLLTLWAFGQDNNPTQPPTPALLSQPAAPAAGSFDEVILKVAERERIFNEQMRRLHPLIETYIQNLQDNDEMGAVPVSDRYFLSRLDVAGDKDDRFLQGHPHHLRSALTSFTKLSALYSLRFMPLGFAQMVLVDDDFQRQYYNFTYVRREFLGEIRCLVIDVQPRKDAGKGRFVGRIWVEDQDFNIVRFNGTYNNRAHHTDYLHFDSWRANLRPGVWLPAYIYSEESGDHSRVTRSLHYKAQIRLWGYDLQHITNNESFTEILVDPQPSVRDQTIASQDASPVESERLWEREAEDNAIERLQRTGLIAPEGEIDKVLQTVINNLIVTNNLNIQPEVRARVLLTTPLESFTIGHTIVLSRGLLDTLPDEACLATIVAHELAHIALGHSLDTKLAFNDRMFFPDEQTFERLNFSRDKAQEEAADTKALELLSTSPYKDRLGNAGLFLRALQSHSSDLQNLIRPHLGSNMAKGDAIRMSSLLNSAPQLEPRKTDQIAALPLGGRVKLDPWSNQVELVKTKPVSLTSAREKMPFEITPFFPYLTRLSTLNPDKVALTAPAKEKEQQ